jgi:hypothetical protein
MLPHQHRDQREYTEVGFGVVEIVALAAKLREASLGFSLDAPRPIIQLVYTG